MKRQPALSGGTWGAIPFMGQPTLALRYPNGEVYRVGAGGTAYKVSEQLAQKWSTNS